MLVSASVSVLDPPPSNSLLHKQFRLEAGVGIGHSIADLPLISM